MKRDYTVLTAVVIVLITAVIVYFGRIYFPNNFHPDTVSFFENWIVLNIGLCFVVGIFSICFFGMWWIGRELIRDIKSLLK
jgi:hypothetical protein